MAIIRVVFERDAEISTEDLQDVLRLLEEELAKSKDIISFREARNLTFIMGKEQIGSQKFWILLQSIFANRFGEEKDYEIHVLSYLGFALGKQASENFMESYQEALQGVSHLMPWKQFWGQFYAVH